MALCAFLWPLIFGLILFVFGRFPTCAVVVEAVQRVASKFPQIFIGVGGLFRILCKITLQLAPTMLGAKLLDDTLGFTEFALIGVWHTMFLTWHEY